MGAFLFFRETTKAIRMANFLLGPLGSGHLLFCSDGVYGFLLSVFQGSSVKPHIILLVVLKADMPRYYRRSLGRAVIKKIGYSGV